MPDSIDGDIRDFIYAYLKTPNPKLISEAVPEVLDENGNVVTPAQEAVYEEQNKWATAENV
jgi:hypothetical protein